jgi:hypothetical protein
MSPFFSKINDQFSWLDKVEKGEVVTNENETLYDSHYFILLFSNFIVFITLFITYLNYE